MTSERMEADSPATDVQEKLDAGSEPDSSAEALLDAISLRSRTEFDPGLAKAMHSVLGEAIRMVEAGTIRSDKATPGVSSLPTYANYLLYPHLQRHREPIDPYRKWHPHAQSVLFSEDVLPKESSENPRPLQVVSLGMGAVDQRDQPPSHDKESGTAPEKEVSARRVFIAGGLPIGITTAGVLLSIGSAVTNPIKPNPYVAISIFILGVGLIFTALVALRERRREI